MRISHAMLTAKLAILARHYPVATGHTLTLLSGSPTYGRPWAMAERDDTTGGLSRVVRLGSSKREAGTTLDAMIHCLTL